MKYGTLEGTVTSSLLCHSMETTMKPGDIDLLVGQEGLVLHKSKPMREKGSKVVTSPDTSVLITVNCSPSSADQHHDLLGTQRWRPVRSSQHWFWGPSSPWHPANASTDLHAATPCPLGFITSAILLPPRAASFQSLHSFILSAAHFCKIRSYTNHLYWLSP